MSQNYVKVFDDTCLKLSIMQGVESERSNTTTGAFTMGELAFTRDTGRVFVGDFTSKQGYTETIGGSLVGNKYLGLIDSKKLPFANIGDDTALPYTSDYTYEESTSVTEGGLLTQNSLYRTHTDGDGDTKQWSREAGYNETYSAYNGDIMYDVYTNSLILFDKRIQPVERFYSNPIGNPNADTEHDYRLFYDEATNTFKDAKGNTLTPAEAATRQRRTTLFNYSYDNPTGSKVSNEVYGKGFVVFRNVEPDNKTLQFAQRAKESTDTQNNANFSHNILEIKEVPASSMTGSFSNDFVNDGNVVALNKRLAGIKSIASSNDKLNVPKTLVFSTGGVDGSTEAERTPSGLVSLTLNKTNSGDLGKYKLQLQRTADSGNQQNFIGEIVRDEVKIQEYFVSLGAGLTANVNGALSDTLVIGDAATSRGNVTLTLGTEFSYNEETDNKKDPLAIGTDSKYVYNGNFFMNSGGIICGVDNYDDTYATLAASKIEKFDNINSPINYLKTPLFIFWTRPNANTSTTEKTTNVFDAADCGASANLQFVVNPYVYCSVKQLSSPLGAAFGYENTTRNQNKSPQSYFSVITNDQRIYWNYGVNVLGNNVCANLYDSNHSDSFALADFHYIGEKIDLDNTSSFVRTSETAVFKVEFKTEVNSSGNIESYSPTTEDGVVDTSVLYLHWFKITDETGTFYVVPDIYLGEVDESDENYYLNGELRGMKIAALHLSNMSDNIIAGGDAAILNFNSKVNGVDVQTFALGMDCGLVIGSGEAKYGEADGGFDAMWAKFVDSNNVPYFYHFVKQGDLDYFNKVYFTKVGTSSYYELAEFPEYVVATMKATTPSGSIIDAKSDLSKFASNGFISINDAVGSTTAYYNQCQSILVGLKPYTIENGSVVVSSDVEYRVFNILTNVVYAKSHEPKLIQSLLYSTSAVNVDESIAAEEQVTIPTTARSVILEIAMMGGNQNDSTERDANFALFTAKNYSDLKMIFSGTATKEYTTSGSLNNDLYHQYTSSIKAYTQPVSGGAWKQQKPTLVSDGTTSIFTPAENEKILMYHRGHSATMVVEVPLVTDMYTSNRVFNIRLANFFMHKNSAFFVRLIGYRA